MPTDPVRRRLVYRLDSPERVFCDIDDRERGVISLWCSNPATMLGVHTVAFEMGDEVTVMQFSRFDFTLAEPGLMRLVVPMTYATVVKLNFMICLRAAAFATSEVGGEMFAVPRLRVVLTSLSSSTVHPLSVAFEPPLDETLCPAPPVSGPKEPAVPDGAKSSVSLQERIDEIERRLFCVVCMHRERNTLFVPCMHLACCRTCSERIADHCPICRSLAVNRVAVVVP